MENNKNTLSIRIKKLRTELGLTQEELALKLGLKGKSSIANYESGNITPSDDIKLKMCEVFGCSMDYLMGLTSYCNPKEELERELSKLDLTEEEFDLAISHVLHYYNNPENIIELFSNCNNLEKNKLLKTQSYIKDKILVITNSLNKRRILHNSDKEDVKYYMCPVYGRISAGIPNWAEECIEGRIPIDAVMFNIINPEDHFFLRVNRRIYE